MGSMGGGLHNPLCLLGDVNCFVLISGYFMITGRFKAFRFIKLAAETVFYSFFITLCFSLLNGSVSVMELIKSAVPFSPTHYSYWFINKFLALLILQPFIATLIKNINKKQYTILLCALYLINSELIIGFPFASLFNNGFALPWMITVYLTGGYIKLYNPMAGFRYWGVAWLVSVAVFIAASVWGNRVFNLEYNQWFFIAKSVCLFMFVRSISVSSASIVGKITTFIAPNVLAAYLIQSQHFMNLWLIETGSKLVEGYSAAATLSVWSLYGIAIIMGCVLCDRLRIFLFKKTGIAMWLNSLGQKTDAYLQL